MKKILALSFLFLLLSFSFASQAQAAGLVPCGGTGEKSCEFCDIFIMVNNILDFLLLPPDGIVFVLAVLMMIIGGVMFFFGGAKADMLTRAKGIITSVVVGLVIIMSAWVIINTILNNIGVIEGSSILRWYDIRCQ